jgi:uncharacterized protein
LNWRARISVKRLVIAAASSRPFVRAATVAGFAVVAADAFCDAETRRDAGQAIQLGYAEGGFEPEEFRRRVFPLLADDQAVFVYGSGFETRPELLEEISRHCRVAGNKADTVRTAKDPGLFFACLAALGLPFPEFSLALPRLAGEWVSKRVGGSGGTHVQAGLALDGPRRYYQRRVPGGPCSLLFLADGRQIRAVGFNQQVLAPCTHMPYRYGGAVSQAVLPRAVRAGMCDAAARITSAMGLHGLNSLDCMVDGECFQVLEVNPRLSATFALYDAATEGARLLLAHLAACAGELALDLEREPSQAHLIYYAPHAVSIRAGIEWPEWVADVPPEGSCILADTPLCTVMATGDDAHGALALARLRIGQLAQQINLLRNQ